MALERNRFPIKSKDTESQRYRCSECGLLIKIENMDDIKLTPDDDGYFDIFCPHCNAEKKMRIIKPSSWVKRMNDSISNTQKRAQNAENGAFVGSYSEFLAESENLPDGSIVVITTNA